jgi:DNA-binding SARP family transcriptional activator
MKQPSLPVSLILLGRIDLRGEGIEADHVLVQSKWVALLALLATPTLGRHVRRDTLVGLLWPELDQERARTALRKAVHGIRAALGAEAVVSRGDEELALSSEIVSADVAAFTHATDNGFLAQALELYKGDLMPGFHLDGCGEFDAWLEGERAVARERGAGAAWALAQRFESEEQFSDAAGMARRAIRFSWSDERALRRALHMLMRLSDRAGAMRLYDEFVRRLRADLDVEPSEETKRLASEIRGHPPPQHFS